VFGGKSERIDAAKLAILRIADRSFDGARTLSVCRLAQNAEKRFVVAFAHWALLTTVPGR
jgi:hypothetical protein